MPTVIVRVNDRPYNMVCDDGEEEHLSELAGLLDAEVTKLKKSFGQVGDSRLLLMAGLVVADKLDEALRRIEDMTGEIEGLKDARSAAVERSRSLETTVADRLVHAAERLEMLSDQLSSAD
ncbi:MAG: cell division protein ZapA [Hyphomicrobiales bacterium]